MTIKAKAAVLRAVGAPLGIETVEIGQLGPTDVLVRNRAAALCHTDLEVIEGSLAFPLPIVLGHEAAGTVAAIGSAVTALKPGDPVALHWNPHCGHCFFCEQDQPILCERFTASVGKALAFDGAARLTSNGQPVHVLTFVGGFCEYAVVSEQGAGKLPPEIPFDRACLLGCGVMTGVGAATRVAQLRWGSAAMVIGCGAVGLSAVQGAKLAGATTIVAVDVDDRKRDVVRKFGATHFCNAAREDAVAFVKVLTGGRGADVVLECAGNEKAFRVSVEACRPGGQVVWLGKVNVDKDVAFRWGSLMGERRFTRSSYGGARPQRDFPLLAQAYLHGTLELDALITRRIRLEEINEGFAALKRGEAIRTVVEYPA
ncbi:MAG: Zn-dependent alcohol dehydrogenase [Alphaproteobacteria bacterium]|nr:Zn-dependent alcohol dehydrogenase [Alphaproteobacteria bacterium]